MKSKLNVEMIVKALDEIVSKAEKDVVREIFAEIEQFAIHSQTINGDLMVISETAFAELKKKYGVMEDGRE